jgi:hypothetical protein
MVASNLDLSKEAAVDYDELKDLAVELDRPVKTLFVLDDWNDPFYITPARITRAEWVAEIWRNLNIPLGYHYRRIHYRMISQNPPLPFFNRPKARIHVATYQNTDQCWDELEGALRDAVYLDLIPLNAFTDMRNPNPFLHVLNVVPPVLNPITHSDPFFYPFHFVMPEMPNYGELLPGVTPQPYHIEIWIEKSTMNDILVPLAQRYRINLVTGVGELSATAVRNLIERMHRNDLPVRILYISDFDPAGRSMPVAIARKLEFELDRQGMGHRDVQVRQIMLTYEQCVEYRLPRTPIKVGERRASRFEQRFGQGATELDALEAIHPGVFATIVTDEIKRYWNPDHHHQVQEQIDAFAGELDEVRDQVRQEHQTEIAEFAAEIKALNQQLGTINQQASELRSRLAPIWQEMVDKLREREPELEVECPDFDGDEDDNPLFDSTREYVEQVDVYKEYQGKPTERQAPQPRQPRQPRQGGRPPMRRGD